MKNVYTIIYNARLIDSTMDCFGTVIIENDKIFSVIPSKSFNIVDVFNILGDDGVANAKKIDAKGLALMPAFVDMHVHFRFPGQTQKEDLISGSNAAAKGGYSTVVLMPNTSPVVSSTRLAAKINKLVAKIGKIDALQTISITKKFNGKTTNHLKSLAKQKRSDSGTLAVPVITEDGKDVLSADVMQAALIQASKAGVIVLCHCEDPKLVPLAKKLRDEHNFLEAEKVLATAENSFTERNLTLALENNCKIHIAHVSTEQAINSIKKAKSTEKGKKLVTCEVTPHHFALNQQMLGRESELVNPPLRPESDMEALLSAIKDGTVDVISTDHAPHTPQDKQNGACGFTGLETAFSIAYTKLVKTGVISVNELVRLMSENPAKILGLNCGSLKGQSFANLALIDLEKSVIIDSKSFASKGKYTPFNGQTVWGEVQKTFHNGIEVYSV